MLSSGPPVVQVDGAITSAQRAAVRSTVLRHGAAIVRGLDLTTPIEVVQAGRTLAGEPLVEREQFARRSELGDGAYSVSEWPEDQPMCPHNEQSYRLDVPGLMIFGCLRPAEHGGAILLADGNEVERRLPGEITGRLEHTGWQVLRNYGEEFIGVPWPEALGTDDPAAAEEYCRNEDIEYAWRPSGGLRTSQRRPAFVSHPLTGERCWFNQAAFLNAFSLEPEVLDVLVAAFGPDGLPFDTRFGDSTPISEQVVRMINEAHLNASVRVPWTQGDLLVVDNIRMAHGREPFTGARQVAVIMAERFRPTEASALAIGRHETGESTLQRFHDHA